MALHFIFQATSNQIEELPKKRKYTKEEKEKLPKKKRKSEKEKPSTSKVSGQEQQSTSKVSVTVKPKTSQKEVKKQPTVSLSRIWFIDEMNPGNGYYSSPDPYLGKQMAPKIGKSTEPFWRKLRLKYEI